MTTKDRLLIQKRHVEDTHLGPQEWWEDKDTVWAHVAPLSAEARAQYQQIAGTTHYRIRLKGRWAISLADHRFKWLSTGGSFLVPTEPPFDSAGDGRVTSVAVRVDPDAVDIPEP